MRKNSTTIVTALLAVFLCFAGGCATSAQFQQDAHILGADLGTQSKKYANADAVIDAPTKAQRVGQADALLSATTQPATITRGSVASAWSAVKGWYSAYIDSDAKLSLVEKQLRHETADHLDAAIAKEAARPFAAP